MSVRPVVRLLTTGGTIATRRDADGVRRPIVSASALRSLLEECGSLAEVDVEVRELSLRPSWSFTPADMDAIARVAVREACAAGVAGVVVTHGTTTLEYSAFLTELRHAGRTPIVFTGAMRRADADEPDGPANLRDAVAVAAHAAAAGHGVLVVLAGRILSAREAWKCRRADLDAFTGLSGGLGRVRDGAVEFTARSLRTRSFAGDLDPRVALIKAYPGAGREFVDAAVAAGARGLVLEGLPGEGGLPEGVRAGVREAVAAGCSVVLSSRAPYGRIPREPTGGTGAPLAGMGLLSAGDLTAEKAWILLMLVLGEATAPARVRETFESVAAVHGCTAAGSS